MQPSVDLAPGVHSLRDADRPAFEDGAEHLRVVDLFAGCGGLTLGAAQAAHAAGVALEIPLAVDFEPLAAEVYAANFPKADLHVGRIEDLLDGELGAELTDREAQLRADVGAVAAAVGGPPCQGHSDLNNRTRRDDPKNSLYARMARAAEVLKPQLVVIENVPAVQHDKNGVVGSVERHLRSLGYDVDAAVVRLDRLGVAQRRKRHVLIATCGELPPASAVLADVLSTQHPSRNLRWAIGDLERIDSGDFVDEPPRASKDNYARLMWLLENNEYDLPNALRPLCHQNDHSYKSMYGRLRWNEPAQTLTSGYTSVGQGRYGHPSRPRALTAHEAARIQGFPDYFTFEAVRKRTALATMIGNAVPPALGRAVFEPLILELANQSKSRTAVLP